MSLLMNIIQVNDVLFCFSCDLKIAIFIPGIQSPSKKHPCCWYDVDSDTLSECGTSRSFGSKKEKFKAFAAGDYLKNLQKILTM